MESMPNMPMVKNISVLSKTPSVLAKSKSVFQSANNNQEPSKNETLLKPGNEKAKISINVFDKQDENLNEKNKKQNLFDNKIDGIFKPPVENK